MICPNCGNSKFKFEVIIDLGEHRPFIDANLRKDDPITCTQCGRTYVAGKLIQPEEKPEEKIE